MSAVSSRIMYTAGQAACCWGLALLFLVCFISLTSE